MLRSVVWRLVPMALVVAGCGGHQDPRKDAAAAGEAAPAAAEASAAGTPKAASSAPAAGDTVVTLDALAVRLAEAASQAQAAEVAQTNRLEAESAAARKALEAVAPPGSLRFYTRTGELNADGQAMVAVLAGLERHGFNKAPYRLQEVDAATAAVAPALQAEQQALQPLQTEPQAGQVAAAAALWVRGGEGGAVQLARAGGDRLSPAALASLSQYAPAIIAAAKASRLAIARADHELLRALVRHIVDQTYARPVHPDADVHTTAGEIKFLTDKHAETIAKAIQESKGKLADALQRYQPRHPQYTLLLGAWDRYKKLVDSGGWKALPAMGSGKLGKGNIGPSVTALRERLQAEGYACGSGDRFDEALVEAVKLFQARHQLEVSGQVNKTMWGELDVPASRRLEQIGLAMQRLRESGSRNAGDEPFFVWVSLGLQRLWVYEAGAPVQSHVVIIGSNETDTDQLTQMKGKINRTRMFSHKMERVVLAPKWYPTSRVVELELAPRLAKDPSFLEQSGYVREVKPDGSERWYQQSGSKNLLGDVKFQGENRYNIYLHDTPFRNKFSSPRRAFSHGCVRVDKPLELADLILGRDRDMDSKEIRKVVDTREERAISLKTPVPVHIDYATVVVDAEGVVLFGSDIYGYDTAYFDHALPVTEAKKYNPGSIDGL